MRIETHHVGGFIAAAPANNRAERWDTATGQYTAWNTAGTVTTTRAFTPAELTRLTEADARLTADTNKTTIEQRAAAFITATNTYLAIPSPTNAQVAAQVRRNAMATVGLVKILLNQLADTDGTA